MNVNDYNELVKELDARGFKVSDATINHETYGWFKVVKDEARNYIIDVQVDDYWIHDPENRPNNDDAYSVSCAIACKSEKFGMLIMNMEKVFSAQQVEATASDFYKLCKEGGML